MNNEKAPLENLSKEEGEEITKEISAVLSKYNAQFVISPLITPQGTIGCTLQIFKVPGLPSPFVPTNDSLPTNEGETPKTA